MEAYWLGTVPYRAACALQQRLVQERAARSIGDVLLLLEHPPTITLGRAARREHILASDETLASLGVDVIETDRGGDVTFHGPGQLVGYLILDLTNLRRDVGWYLRSLEQTLIAVCERLGIAARTFPPHTGVWVEDRKIAAIGIRVKRWVTSHGFALNVHDVSSWFRLIVPCGIIGCGVTSLEQELGLTPEPGYVRRVTADACKSTFRTTAPLTADTANFSSARIVRIMAETLDTAAVALL